MKYNLEEIQNLVKSVDNLKEEKEHLKQLLKEGKTYIKYLHESIICNGKIEVITNLTAPEGRCLTIEEIEG